MPLLFANPEDRFSHVPAKFIFTSPFECLLFLAMRIERGICLSTGPNGNFVNFVVILSYICMAI